MFQFQSHAVGSLLLQLLSSSFCRLWFSDSAWLSFSLFHVILYIPLWMLSARLFQASESGFAVPLVKSVFFFCSQMWSFSIVLPPLCLYSLQHFPPLLCLPVLPLPVPPPPPHGGGCSGVLSTYSSSSLMPLRMATHCSSSLTFSSKSATSLHLLHE